MPLCDSIPLIIGPTAVGKTEVAHKLARKTNSEIISADSRAVYKGLEIGTATPEPRLIEEVPYHLISFLDPRRRYSAKDFQRDVEEKIQKIADGCGKPIIVGGSRLYVKALTQGLFEGPGADREIRSRLSRRSGEELHHRLQEVDPKSAENIHPNDQKRLIRALEVYEITGRPISVLQDEAEPLPHSLTKIALLRDRKSLYRRIEERVEELIDRGLVQEVRELLQRGFSEDWGAWNTIGYKELVLHLEGEISLEEAKEAIKTNTRHLAKYQLGWIRSEECQHQFDLDKSRTSQVVERLVSLTYC
ncbi:MAG: tRNA (adenosine(37)-N6)-dimethylallyltransferase MiaA [Candidatus Bipolaricaulota bacterium]